MDTVEARAHRNLCDLTRWNARLDPRTVLLDESGVVAIAGTRDFPTARTAIRSDASLSAERWVDTVAEFFTRHGRTGCVFTRVGADDDITELLGEQGFREWATSPEMVCDHALEAREPAPGITVRFADSPADISAYARIAAEAFSHLHLPPSAAYDGLDHPDVLLAGDCVVALAEQNGEPVAGAQVVLLGDEPLGYVGWVSCADAARGQGLGDTVTRAVTNEAFRRGATLVTLEASPFGEHTYARMGYREIYRYRTLIRI